MPDDPSGRRDSADPSIESAQPYRTPATLDGTGGKASRKALMIWGLLLASVSIAAAATFLLLTPSVSNFGENRARPIREMPQYVEDFGATRMSEDEYNSLNDIPHQTDSKTGDHSSDTSVP